MLLPPPLSHVNVDINGVQWKLPITFAIHNYHCIQSNVGFHKISARDTVQSEQSGTGK